MSFAWPEALWLLAIVPALVAGYLALLRRRRKSALRYASLALLREAGAGPRRLRRHLPPLLFLLALTVLIVAAARPRATVTLPSEQRTIILAMDTSLSMRATDVAPSRLGAAREAAKAFVQQQPADVRIGIVAFAAQAVVVQQPTRDREELVAAIDRLQLQVHTAIGSAIIVSLGALFPEEGLELDAETFGAGATGKAKAAPIDRAPASARPELKPVPPGSYPSGAIILLTDGRRTIGPDPVAAARLAADHGVKVYTVGFGSESGAAVEIEGRSIFMRYDAETLQAIAALTQGEYFHAASGTDLKRVYEGLNARYVLERNATEVTALAAALAALALLAAGALSIAWFGRIA